MSQYSDISKKVITTILYGSILYVVLHAYLSNSGSTFVQSLHAYFWIVFTLDVASIGYLFLNSEASTTTGSESIGKLMDSIRNVINTTSNNVPVDNKSSDNDKILSTPISELPSPTTNLENLPSRSLSTDFEEIMRQRLAPNDSRSECGSDIGSVGDIDMKDFEATLAA